MRSVNFDNPWLLLLAVPLLLAVIIPFIIAIRKENRQKSTIISLSIHLIIVLLVTLAAAGAMITTILTETTVYVVADVSYSSERELDLIDEYIEDIEGSLPRNAKLGVVCFGKDSAILYEPGADKKSVKEAVIDSSATDIVSALNYTASLYKEGVIKKMVLITDGRSTDTKARGKLISTMEALEQKKITLDAVFVDSTISDNEKEIQISDIERVGRTYLDVEAKAKVLLQANYEGNAIVTLYVKAPNSSEYVAQPYTVESVTYGYNMVEVPLVTSEAGYYDYRVEIEGEGDTCQGNNSYEFGQEVDSELDVLLVTGNKDDISALELIYNERASLTSVYVQSGKPVVGLPYTLEELSKYDEIIISNLDIRNLPNVTSFLYATEIVVSQYGKTLTTMGNLDIQNKTDDTLGALGDMLSVSYGNSAADPKLYTLVLDTSHSMNQAFKFRATKDAAKSLLSLLSDDDMVCVIAFSQDSKTIQPPVRLGDKRNEIDSMIENLKPSQGTFLGTAMATAFNAVRGYQVSENQVMLISDGKTNSYDVDAVEIARSMKIFNIVVSTINVATQDEAPKKLLEDIANTTGGESYYLSSPEEASDFIFATVADDVTEFVIEADSPVHIEYIKDSLLVGKKTQEDDITYVPNIQGYVQTKAKSDANVVLSVDYVKDSATVRVPLYTWREYGNGKVATLSTSPSGKWISGWDDSFKSLIFGNMLNSNMPKEKISHPFTFTTSFDGAYLRVEIIPASVRTDGKATLKVTLPDGTQREEALIFDTEKFYCDIPIFELYKDGKDVLGRYELEATYSYNENPEGVVSKSYHNVSYLAEYNMFASYTPSALHAFVEGEVVNGKGLVIKNNENELATYEYRFTVPFLIIALVLFVADVAIRVIKIRKKSKIKKTKVVKEGAK